MAKKYDIKTNKYGVGATTAVLWLSRAGVPACVCWAFWCRWCRVKHAELLVQGEAWLKLGYAFSSSYTHIENSDFSLHRKLF